MYVVIDTSALMEMGRNKVDVLSLVASLNGQVALVSGTLDELEHLGTAPAKLALAIIKSKKLLIIPSTGHVDDVLVDLSEQGHMIVTQDKGLKKRLTSYVTIRQHKYLKRYP